MRQSQQEDRECLYAAVMPGPISNLANTRDHRAPLEQRMYKAPVVRPSTHTLLLLGHYGPLLLCSGDNNLCFQRCVGHAHHSFSLQALRRHSARIARMDTARDGACAGQDEVVPEQAEQLAQRRTAEARGDARDGGRRASRGDHWVDEPH